MIVTKYIVCSREGLKNSSVQHSHSISNADAEEGSSIPKRKRVSNRTGCKARIILTYMRSVEYVVKTFE